MPIDYKKRFTQLQVDIVDRWKKTKVVHPSYGEIAKDLGCSVDTVFRTVKKFAQLNNDNDKNKRTKSADRPVVSK